MTPLSDVIIDCECIKAGRKVQMKFVRQVYIMWPYVIFAVIVGVGFGNCECTKSVSVMSIDDCLANLKIMTQISDVIIDYESIGADSVWY